MKPYRRFLAGLHWLFGPTIRELETMPARAIDGFLAAMEEIL